MGTIKRFNVLAGWIDSVVSELFFFLVCVSVFLIDLKTNLFIA